MTFFARPNLGNIEFKQLSGTTLTLNGQTQIATVSGLTLSDGTGNNVIVTASGATSGSTGKVLTFDGNVIKLMTSSLSGDTSFICGIENIRREPYEGLNMNSTTVGTFLEKFFFPDAPPTSDIYFTTGSISRQYGDISYIGTCNLCWSVTGCTNAISTISASTGGTGSYDTTISVSGGSQNGLLYHTYSPTIYASPITPTGSTTATFRICATTISGETTSDSISINWSDTNYGGGNANNYIGSSSGTTNLMVDSLSCSYLASGGSKCFCNFCVGNDNFFYYTYPSIFGLPQQISVNGLPNNSWGCAAIGTLGTYTRCNTDGYCQEFYLIRSDNKISGSFNINITTIC